MPTKRKPVRPKSVLIAKTLDGSLVLGQPGFGQPTSSPDPSSFVTAHGSDKSLYARLQRYLLQAVPKPKVGDPAMTLADAWGSAGPGVESQIQKNNQIVFHCVGDSGSVKGPQTQSVVADKVTGDYDEANPADRPSFTSPTVPVQRLFLRQRETMTEWFTPAMESRHSPHSSGIL